MTGAYFQMGYKHTANKPQHTVRQSVRQMWRVYYVFASHLEVCAAHASSVQYITVCNLWQAARFAVCFVLQPAKLDSSCGLESADDTYTTT
jgi:hypothetical protein